MKNLLLKYMIFSVLLISTLFISKSHASGVNDLLTQEQIDAINFTTIPFTIWNYTWDYTDIDLYSWEVKKPLRYLTLIPEDFAIFDNETGNFTNETLRMYNIQWRYTWKSPPQDDETAFFLCWLYHGNDAVECFITYIRPFYLQVWAGVHLGHIRLLRSYQTGAEPFVPDELRNVSII